MDRFRIESRDDSDERQIWVFGEIDMSTIDEFWAAVAADPPRRLLVDMSECSFIDLAGLECLEEINRRADLSLVPSPQVLRLLELTATTDLFQIETARD